MIKQLTTSAEETFQIGQQFGQSLPDKCAIAFRGDLGAGKTTFIRGLAAAHGVPAHEVCSPTFVYLNIYQGKTQIYHFDLYRLVTPQEFIAAGFDEYLSAEGICCIEWSERIADLLPKTIYTVSIEAIDEIKREITIYG